MPTPNSCMCQAHHREHDYEPWLLARAGCRHRPHTMGRCSDSCSGMASRLMLLGMPRNAATSSPASECRVQHCSAHRCSPCGQLNVCHQDMLHRSAPRPAAKAAAKLARYRAAITLPFIRVHPPGSKHHGNTKHRGCSRTLLPFSCGMVAPSATRLTCAQLPQLLPAVS